jgi:hypothetical protein
MCNFAGILYVVLYSCVGNSFEYIKDRYRRRKYFALRTFGSHYLKNFVLREKTLQLLTWYKIFVVYIFSHGLFRLLGLCRPWKLWRNLFLSSESISPIGRMMVSDRWTYILVCILSRTGVLHSPPVLTFIFVRGQEKKRYNVRQCFWTSNFNLCKKFITVFLYYFVSTFIKVKFYERGETC